MGIRINDGDVIAMYIGDTAVLSVYTNEQLVWPDQPEDIQSCYASGYWIDSYQWSDDTPWVD